MKFQSFRKSLKNGGSGGKLTPSYIQDHIDSICKKKSSFHNSEQTECIDSIAHSSHRRQVIKLRTQESKDSLLKAEEFSASTFADYFLTLSKLEEKNQNNQSFRKMKRERKKAHAHDL